MNRSWYIAATLLTASWCYPAFAQAQPRSDETLSLADTTETLRQDFQKAPVWRSGGVQVNDKPKPLSDKSFSWAAGYIWNHPAVGTANAWPPPERNFPAWTSNGNADADPNGDMIVRLGTALSPLTWAGTLNITARKMPSDIAATVPKDDPHDYIGGSITSFPYAQLYGVFAMSAKLPGTPGVWPAFWLLPADKTWPPEIDIMEVIGKEPSTLYTTLHNVKDAPGHGTPTQTDLSANFHEYAVDWGPEKILWYFDRKLVFSQPTPPELHKPCYILANLAVGKPNDWGGAPTASTILPATMKISSIKVWQRQAYFNAQNAQ